MIAQVLDQDKVPSEMLPFVHNQPAKGIEQPWTYTVDEDLWARLGQPALDMFDDFLTWMEDDQGGAPAQFMIETKAEFPGLEDILVTTVGPDGETITSSASAFGTSDVPFRCGKIGGIWDWKFGHNPVSAEDNKQLKFYFRSLLHKFPKFFEGVERVILCISQPAVNDQEPEVWETTMEDIMQFEVELHDAIALAMTKDAPIERGPWCRFADCKTICELHVKATAKLGDKMAKLKAHKEQGEPIMDMGAFLSEACELADMAEDWCKHVKGISQERLEAGLPVPGWKIVPKRSPGSAFNPELSEQQVINMLRTRGLKADDYYNKKLISAPQARDKLKALGKTLPDGTIVKLPSSGYTMTKEADPRQEAVPPAKKAAALGASLQRKLESKKG